jgi:hypothetical protein
MRAILVVVADVLTQEAFRGFESLRPDHGWAGPSAGLGNGYHVPLFPRGRSRRVAPVSYRK